MAPSQAIAPSAVASVVGIETVFRVLREGVVLLPQRVAIIGQAASSAYPLASMEKKTVFSEFEAGQEFGFGSPVHMAAEQLLPANGDGIGTIPLTIYPVVDGTTAALGDITPTGAAQGSDKVYYVKINEKLSEAILIPKDATPTEAIALFIAGINANVRMPALASDGTTKINLTAKSKGEYGNDLYVEVIGEIDGLTFPITQPGGGAGNPDVQPALDKFGNVWETLVLNCMNIEDTVALDKYTAFGEGRWQPIQPKPCIVFTGNTETSVSVAVVVSDGRKTDRINSQLVAPASNELPLVVAARQMARIAVIANENPPTNYEGQLATGIAPGADDYQWTPSQREFAVRAGSSTVQVVDNVLEMIDTTTFYHPTGDVNPAYRYVVSILKVMNVTFNLRLIFEDDNWKGKVLISDGQPTTNANARRPSTAKAAVAKMIDSLALEAIIVNPEQAKASIQADISESNPNRLDLSFTYQISGNTNQISITANWGFNFGGQVAA